MTIRHLKIFIEVADTGKMSRAASRFYLSQPAVSQSIAELERHYGVKLFDRLSQRLYITEAGRQLLSMARQVVLAFDNLETGMMQLSDSPILRIGATVTVGSSLIGRAVARYRKEQPGADLRVLVDNTATIERGLLDSSLDLALVEGQIQSPDLVTTPVVEDYLVLVCRPDHPLARRGWAEPSDLGKERFILREEGSGTRELFTRYMADRGIPLTVGWTCSGADTIREAVLLGEGMTVISVRLVAEELQSGTLVAVPVREDGSRHGWVCRRGWICRRKFSLVLHKNKLITPAISAMLAIIRDFFQEDVTGLLPGGGEENPT